MSVCEVAECPRDRIKRQWCDAHYLRWLRNGSVQESVPLRRYAPDALCDVEECPRDAKRRGWCKKHYQTWRRNGDPTATYTRAYPSLESAFFKHLSKTNTVGIDDTWAWPSAITGAGYGVFRWRSDLYIAHRVSYEVFHEKKVPDGLVVDHKCGVHHCVNPNHLAPETSGRNSSLGGEPHFPEDYSPVDYSAKLAHLNLSVVISPPKKLDGAGSP